MKRIWFKSDTIQQNSDFVEYMGSLSTEVVYGKTNTVPEDRETLVITDDKDVFSKEDNCLVFIRDEKEMNMYPSAKYFVMDVYEAEYDYFLKIWQRFNNIPWTIADTKRLIIRETVEEDLPGLKKIYEDKEVTRYTEDLFEEPEDELNYIREYREKVYGIQGFGIWSVIRKEDGKLIGRAGLVARPEYDGVEVGFVFGKDYRNRGYATEAVTECLNMAKKMEFENVRALTMSENASAVKLLSKLGFKKIGSEKNKGILYDVWEIN